MNPTHRKRGKTSKGKKPKTVVNRKGEQMALPSKEGKKR